jgi:acrylyl-CoA reductase (NADPH)
LQLRQEAWSRLASDLDRSKIAAMVNEIGFDEVIAAGRRIIDGKVRGRIVVKIG